MPVPADLLGHHLRTFDFRSLIVEALGWNHYRASLVSANVDDHEYVLEPTAEKAGFAVYVCSPGPGGGIPSYPTRRKIEREVAKLAFEHLLVFVDGRQRTQVWQWVKREGGARDVCREQWFRRGLSGESLLQSLRAIAFSLEEESTADAVEVASRVRRGFDRETLYSRFTEGFRKRTLSGEHTERPSAAVSAAEAAFSSELANALRGKHPRWVERIGALDGNAGQYPGIVVRHPGGAPVVVTTGFEPTQAAETAARDSVGVLIWTPMAMQTPRSNRPSLFGYRTNCVVTSTSLASVWTKLSFGTAYSHAAKARPLSPCGGPRPDGSLVASTTSQG